MTRFSILKINWPFALRIGLSIFLTGMSALAYAGNFNGGGGGTDLVFEFKGAARKAIDELSHHTTLRSLPSSKILRKLETAKIIVSEERLYETFGRIKQEVAALNYRRRNLIVISRPMWMEIKSQLRKEALALHEVLSLMKLEGTGDYRYSQRYFEGKTPRSEVRFTDVMKQQTLNTVESPAVTLVIYEDLLSPYASHNDQAMQEILKSFGDRVQIVVRNFPITVLHSESRFAALVGICANEQALFPEFRAKIINASSKQLDVTRDQIEEAFRSIPKLDQSALAKCLESQRPQLKLDADIKMTEDLHLIGSPTVIVSSKHQSHSVSGSWPYEHWEELLTKMLKTKEFREEFPIAD